MFFDNYNFCLDIIKKFHSIYLWFVIQWKTVVFNLGVENNIWELVANYLELYAKFQTKINEHQFYNNQTIKKGILQANWKWRPSSRKEHVNGVKAGLTEQDRSYR